MKTNSDNESLLRLSDLYFEMLEGVERFSDVPEVSSNPFMGSLADSMEMKRVVKHAMNGIGSANIINTDTGEVVSSMSENRIFTKKEYVDSEKFAKIYIDRIRDIFELSKTALNVFSYFLDALSRPVNINRDLIYFNVQDCLAYTGYSQANMVYMGMIELIKKGMIAKSNVRDHYYIDPKTAFNGNRVLIMEEYIKKEDDPLKSIGNK